MGIIKSQAIKGSIWSYVGVVLGFINLGILSQKFFTTEQVGLTQVLISFATIFSQVGTLGMGNVAARLFPHFRNEDNKHFGFIGLSILVAFGGFLLMSLITFLFEPVFVSSKSDVSNLFLYLPSYFLFTVFRSVRFVQSHVVQCGDGYFFARVFVAGNQHSAHCAVHFQSNFV